ncbi:MAG: glycoside hydrolase family 2 TIM barrel-domain containing protein, partial [Melioribacteraceae bacterium]|nr:glycoside hydrolase family 2 TIM barrel-domain containing protein [Melioribacteraceae bacterium]
MKKIYILSVLIIVFASSCMQSLDDKQAIKKSSETQLEIKDGWYYINGQKFFVNALGYEIGARPGQHPYVKRYSEPQRVKNDVEAIKLAGFNAIRTWSELSEEELKVVQESGLKVVFGIGIRPDEDFSDPKVIDEFMSIVKNVLAYSKNYDCIITYLIMNEPMPQHIKKVGAQATVDLWTKIRDLIHIEHRGIPVTISGNSAITEFVDMNLFDVYAYNAYDYDGFNYTHGYANASRILPELNGQGKPLLLTEFGLSVSRRGGESRYGGNTLYEQMKILPWYYRQLLDAGAAGAC